MQSFVANSYIGDFFSQIKRDLQDMKGSNPHPSVSSPPSHTHTHTQGWFVNLFVWFVVVASQEEELLQAARPAVVWIA